MSMVAEHPGHLPRAPEHHVKPLCGGQGELIIELELQLLSRVVLLAFQYRGHAISLKKNLILWRISHLNRWRQ